MIDHITFGVRGLARLVAFYDRAFAPLGITRLITLAPELTNGVKVTGYGDTRP